MEDMFCVKVELDLRCSPGSESAHLALERSGANLTMGHHVNCIADKVAVSSASFALVCRVDVSAQVLWAGKRERTENAWP